MKWFVIAYLAFIMLVSAANFASRKEHSETPPISSVSLIVILFANMACIAWAWSQ